MTIELFDIENGKLTPTKHCYAIKTLKDIMEKYPKDYINIYLYLFYMSCMNKEKNPFVDVPEIDKEELILREVGGNFSPDEKQISEALSFTQKLYLTTRGALYKKMKISVESLADFLATNPVVGGKDGNVDQVLKALEKYDGICKSFEGREAAFEEEQQATQTRGGNQLAYDQN